jgi:hypothetical protein
MIDDKTTLTLAPYDERHIAALTPQQKTEYARHLLASGHSMEAVERRFGNLNSTSPQERAAAEKTSLKKNPEWVKRYLDGGHEERKKMDQLNRAMHNISI